MFTRGLPFASLFAVAAFALSPSVAAGKTTTGRLAVVSQAAITVSAGEQVTISIDENTMYTKWITERPWQQDTRLDARWLKVGRLVAVHPARDDDNKAAWVQIATDAPMFVPGATPAAAQPKRAEQASGSRVTDLVANARTAQDHLKLSMHFSALAARYEADADEHQALAKLYRRMPNASETKRPSGPDTAVHCERFAERARDAAKAAKELATIHETLARAAE